MFGRRDPDPIPGRQHTDPRAPLGQPADDQAAFLVLERPSRYTDRAARYYAWIDGVEVRPGLQSNSSVTLALPAGEHVLELRMKRYRPTMLRLDLNPGYRLRVLLVPSPMRGWWRGDRGPIARIDPVTHRK